MEEIARMVLDDVESTAKLKALRHNLIEVDFGTYHKLIQSRNSVNDIGASLEVAGDEKTRDLKSVLIANARRVQQGLRVLEEFSRMPEISMSSNIFSDARFEVYKLEQDLIGKLGRQEKKRILNGLYVILDMELLKGKDYLEITRKIIRGGCRIIQLRDKFNNKRIIYSEASELRDLCKSYNVVFVVNDHVDIAIAVQADGVHVGQKDLPVSVVRELVPLNMIVGCSVTSIDLALKAVHEGADYLGVGSIFNTATKSDAEVIGLEGLSNIKQVSTVPVFAIGGINHDNVRNVMSTGVDGIAVITAVLLAEDPENATREFIKLMGLD